jgi:opacity protein-like surface antigen
MGNSKALFMAAAVASGASFAANAADLLPPPPPIEAPMPAPEFGGWYLRGDAGVGAVQMSGWRSTLQPIDGTGQSLATSGTFITPAFASIGDQGFIDMGVGYQFNGWFRADITGEYRTQANYRAGMLWANAFSGGSGGDYYNSGVSTALFMANGYVDLGTWHGVTPYIGGGVGIADHRFSSLVDSGGAGIGVSAEKTQANFAWAVMAGLALNVTPNLKVELGYRYVDMGSLTSNPVHCLNPQGCWLETHGMHLASNDIRIGFRYAFNELPMMPMRPLVTKY